MRCVAMMWVLLCCLASSVQAFTDEEPDPDCGARTKTLAMRWLRTMPALNGDGTSTPVLAFSSDDGNAFQVKSQALYDYLTRESKVRVVPVTIVLEGSETPDVGERRFHPCRVGRYLLASGRLTKVRK